jgi:hypothetical protein
VDSKATEFLTGIGTSSERPGRAKRHVALGALAESVGVKPPVEFHADLAARVRALFLALGERQIA